MNLDDEGRPICVNYLNGTPCTSVQDCWDEASIYWPQFAPTGQGHFVNCFPGKKWYGSGYPEESNPYPDGFLGRACNYNSNATHYDGSCVWKIDLVEDCDNDGLGCVNVQSICMSSW